MKIAIKFCGGCNPRYDRKKIYDKILTILSKGNKLTTVDQNEIYDILIVLRGCTCCSDEYLEINAKYKYFIHNEIEADEIINKIQKQGV